MACVNKNPRPIRPGDVRPGHSAACGARAAGRLVFSGKPPALTEDNQVRENSHEHKPSDLPQQILHTYLLSRSLNSIVQHPTGQDDVHLPSGEIMPDHEVRLLGGVGDDNLLAPSDLLRKLFDPQGIALTDTIIILPIHKDQWQDPEVDQIGPMDAGERLDDGPLSPRYIGARAACSRLEPWP